LPALHDVPQHGSPAPPHDASASEPESTPEPLLEPLPLSAAPPLDPELLPEPPDDPLDAPEPLPVPELLVLLVVPGGEPPPSVDASMPAPPPPAAGAPVFPPHALDAKSSIPSPKIETRGRVAGITRIVAHGGSCVTSAGAMLSSERRRRVVPDGQVLRRARAARVGSGGADRGR
jgi:hypothetical protein